MAIVQQVDSESQPIAGGGVLKDVPLYVSCGDSTSRVGNATYSIVLSRPCNVEHSESVILGAIVPSKENPNLDKTDLGLSLIHI